MTLHQDKLARMQVRKEDRIFYVGGIIRNKEGKILILRRSRTAPWEPNKWNVPSGKVEINENPSEALIRELKEELLLTVGREDVWLMESFIQKDNSRSFYYNVSVDDLALQFLTLNYENDGVDWISVNELEKQPLIPELGEHLCCIFDPNHNIQKALTGLIGEGLLVKSTTDHLGDLVKAIAKGTHKKDNPDYEPIYDGTKITGYRKKGAYEAKSDKHKGKVEESKKSLPAIGEQVSFKNKKGEQVKGEVVKHGVEHNSLGKVIHIKTDHGVYTRYSHNVGKGSDKDGAGEPKEAKKPDNEDAKPKDSVESLDKEKNELLEKVKKLSKEHKSLYGNADIESPKSKEEKSSEKEIADIYSKINTIVSKKKELAKEQKPKTLTDHAKETSTTKLKQHISKNKVDTARVAEREVRKREKEKSKEQNGRIVGKAKPEQLNEAILKANEKYGDMNGGECGYLANILKIMGGDEVEEVGEAIEGIGDDDKPELALGHILVKINGKYYDGTGECKKPEHEVPVKFVGDRFDTKFGNSYYTSEHGDIDAKYWAEMHDVLSSHINKDRDYKKEQEQDKKIKALKSKDVDKKEKSEENPIIHPTEDLTNVVKEEDILGTKFELCEVKPEAYKYAGVNTTSKLTEKPKSRFFLTVEGHHIIGYDAVQKYHKNTGETRWDLFLKTKEDCQLLLKKYQEFHDKIKGHLSSIQKYPKMKFDKMNKINELKKQCMELFGTHPTGVD